MRLNHVAQENEGAAEGPGWDFGRGGANGGVMFVYHALDLSGFN